MKIDWFRSPIRICKLANLSGKLMVNGVRRMLIENSGNDDVQFQVLSSEFAVTRKTLAKCWIATAVAFALPLMVEFGDGAQAGNGIAPTKAHMNGGVDILHPRWVHT